MNASTDPPNRLSSRVSILPRPEGPSIREVVRDRAQVESVPHALQIAASICQFCLERPRIAIEADSRPDETMSRPQDARVVLPGINELVRHRLRYESEQYPVSALWRANPSLPDSRIAIAQFSIAVVSAIAGRLEKYGSPPPKAQPRDEDRQVGQWVLAAFRISEGSQHILSAPAPDSDARNLSEALTLASHDELPTDRLLALSRDNGNLSFHQRPQTARVILLEFVFVETTGLPEYTRYRLPNQNNHYVDPQAYRPQFVRMHRIPALELLKKHYGDHATFVQIVPDDLVKRAKSILARRERVLGARLSDADRQELLSELATSWNVKPQHLIDAVFADVDERLQSEWKSLSDAMREEALTALRDGEEIADISVALQIPMHLLRYASTSCLSPVASGSSTSTPTATPPPSSPTPPSSSGPTSNSFSPTTSTPTPEAGDAPPSDSSRKSPSPPSATKPSRSLGSSGR